MKRIAEIEKLKSALAELRQQYDYGWAAQKAAEEEIERLKAELQKFRDNAFNHDNGIGDAEGGPCMHCGVEWEELVTGHLPCPAAARAASDMHVGCLVEKTEELLQANHRIDALRAALVKHRDDLVRLEKSRKHFSPRIRSWIDELNEAIAADSAAASPVVAVS